MFSKNICHKMCSFATVAKYNKKKEMAGGDC